MKRFGETRDRKPGNHKITTRRAATITSYPGQIGVSGSSVTADLGTTSVATPLRDGEETKRSNGYQRAFLAFSTRPLNRAIVQPRIDIQRRLHDGPAWPCTGELCPCICRQPPGIVSACRRDDLGVAKANVTVKRITPFRSIPAVPQGRTRESIPGAWFGPCRKTNSRANLLVP